MRVSTQLAMEAGTSSRCLELRASTACPPSCPTFRSVRRLRAGRQSRTHPVVPLFNFRGRPAIVASSGLTHPGEEQDQAGQNDLPLSLSVPTTAMAKGLGSSGGAATLSRSKLSLKQEVSQVSPKVDDGGSGGDNGKSIFNGGGGDGDDGDDDDYFFEDDGEGGDGDGDGFFRKVLPQLYDKLSIGAVLAEWYRTIADMPIFLRRAVEMGLFSSAQLVRFCSMDIRPNITRLVSRQLPPTMSRAFVGRLMADPAFLHKLVLENALALGGSLIYEGRMRGENFSKELDFVAINTIGLMSATTMMVWLLAPSRSFGAVQKLPWQKMMSDMPNNVFDASGPLRNYTNQTRVASLFAKFAELSVVGMVTGAATNAAGHLAVMARQRKEAGFEPSVPLPSLGRSALGMGAYFGVHAHLRYQAIGGIDRYLFDHSNFLWSYLSASTLFRATSVWCGELARPLLQGLPTEVPKRVVRRPVMRSNVQPRVPQAVPEAAPKPKPRKKRAKGFELSMVNADP